MKIFQSKGVHAVEFIAFCERKIKRPKRFLCCFSSVWKEAYKAASTVCSISNHFSCQLLNWISPLLLLSIWHRDHNYMGFILVSQGLWKNNSNKKEGKVDPNFNFRWNDKESNLFWLKNNIGTKNRDSWMGWSKYFTKCKLSLDWNISF